MLTKRAKSAFLGSHGVLELFVQTCEFVHIIAPERLQLRGRETRQLLKGFG